MNGDIQMRHIKALVPLRKTKLFSGQLKSSDAEYWMEKEVLVVMDFRNDMGGTESPFGRGNWQISLQKRKW